MLRSKPKHAFGAVHAAACAALLLTAGCQQSVSLGPVADEVAATKIREALLSGDGGGEVQAAESGGTGWATLKGRFVYEGTPPVMPAYDVKGGDMQVCSPGGVTPKQETLVVDPETGGIANIAVYVRKAPRVHESAQALTDSVLFDQKECVFLSHVFAINVGQTMAIKNSDPVGHNTNIEGKNAFNQTVPAGGTVEWPITKEEALPKAVRCSIHPWMLSYLLPRKDRYFAVTNEKGEFEIAYLPAGEDVELQVWHESAPGNSGAVVLKSPEAKELSWSSKGRFTVRLDPDSTKNLDLAVPSSAFGG